MSTRCVANLASITKILKCSTCFNRNLNKVNLLVVENGQCKAEMVIDENHTNAMGGLHGGLSATLVDVISQYALSSKEGISNAQASVDLHLSYLKGPTVGDSIIIDAKIVKSGKTLAFLDVLITNKNTGDILVKGSHTIFIKR